MVIGPIRISHSFPSKIFALMVKGINESQKRLVNDGAKLVGSGEPKLGAHGKLVIFLHPKDFNGTLIELEQI